MTEDHKKIEGSHSAMAELPEAELFALVENLQQQIEDLHGELAVQISKTSILHEVVNMMLTSRSWKLTQPLRAVTKMANLISADSSEKNPDLLGLVELVQADAQKIHKTELVDLKPVPTGSRTFEINHNKDELLALSGDLVLLVTNETSLTGAPLVLLEIARGLKSLGMVPVIVISKGGNLEWTFSNEFVTIRLQEKRDLGLQLALKYLFDELGLRQPRFAICNTASTGWALAIIKPYCRSLITLIHEIVDPYPQLFLQSIVENSTTMVFPARFVQHIAEYKLGRTIKNSAILPTALVDLLYLNEPEEHCRALIRQKLGIGEGSKIILSCGSSDSRKGFDLFSQIALATHHFYKGEAGPAHFVWIGKGVSLPNSIAYFQEWDRQQTSLRDFIHFTPPTPDIRPFFHGSDIFLLPSRQDPFPGVVHNAMASKLPVVAFENAGGVPEMLAYGGGICVPYGDIIAMAQTLADLLRSPDKCREIGEHGHQSVTSSYLMKDYIEKLLLLISSTADSAIKDKPVSQGAQ